MTDDEINLTIADYEDSISKLRAYRAKEPDQQKRAGATQQIAALLQKIDDLAWLGITSRTEALRYQMEILKAITDNAGSGSAFADELGKLKGTVARAAVLAGGQRLKCKTCGVGIVDLPNALAAVAAGGNKLKITLTCSNGHTADYEVKVG